MENLYECLSPEDSLQLAKDVQEWYKQSQAIRTAETTAQFKLATDKCSELFDKWRYKTVFFNLLTVRAVNEHSGRISKSEKLKQ